MGGRGDGERQPLNKQSHVRNKVVKLTATIHPISVWENGSKRCKESFRLLTDGVIIQVFQDGNFPTCKDLPNTFDGTMRRVINQEGTGHRDRTLLGYRELKTR